MANRVPITIRLESFEGPLDLLLYLIQSHELEISKISISKITDQYLVYVKLMQELNFDIASEFLVMAATLLLWKSKALLPQEEGELKANEDDEIALSQEDLVRQLLEHRKFQQAGQDLAQLPRLGEDVFHRPNRRPPIEKVWKTMDLSTLSVAYQDQLVRERKRKQILRKETVSIADKIIEFCHRLEVNRPTGIYRLMSPAPLRPEVVATFLASLELSRMKKMKLHQEAVYAEIYLELLMKLDSQDLHLAGAGFEYAAHEAMNASNHAVDYPSIEAVPDGASSLIEASAP